jgi:cytochrome c oxidase subunit IV
MTIGAGIFLIAVGAILKFATNIHVQGVSIDTIGVILMIAGAAGLLIGLFQEITWSRRARPVAPGEAPPPAVEERREVRDPAYRDQPPRY